jgi:hypothetical protein
MKRRDAARSAEDVWQAICWFAARSANIPEPLAAEILETGGFWERCWCPKGLDGPEEVLAAGDRLVDDAIAHVLAAVSTRH